MRLLDLVAQSKSAPPELPGEWPFPSAHHYADAIRACPLRLVLADDLILCTTQLAYAEGERLAGCLDLLHVSSQQVWVEWLDATREAALRQVPYFAVNQFASGRQRAGVLIEADSSGRSGAMRTFWSMPNGRVYAGALVTEFNLDSVIRPPFDLREAFSGGAVGVVTPEEPSLDGLLNHMRFRFDSAWAAYYRCANLSDVESLTILRHALGTTAFDLPMVFALFLLFAAKDGVVRRSTDLERLNHARRRQGREELLEHIELRAPINVKYDHGPDVEDASDRRSPRLHHVRGHIARRGDKVFWRSPHLRGSAHLGRVRSRTVELSFH
jgi:hypothetical protein